MIPFTRDSINCGNLSRRVGIQFMIPSAKAITICMAAKNKSGALSINIVTKSITSATTLGINSSEFSSK